MRFGYLFLAAAMFALAACEDPKENGPEPGQDPNVDINYWSIHELAPKGVKSIIGESYTVNYDNAGRITSYVTDYITTTYSYNSKGLPVTIVSEQTYGEEHYTTTQTFEYNNTGKFCPYPMGPGNIFHILDNGLVPDLSKVTWASDEEDTIVMEYKFKGDQLTVSTSGGNRTKPDSLGNMVPVVYDDLVFEYKGTYPYQIELDHEFLGPITYQENGMFDSYVEGLYSWEAGFEGIIISHRTFTVNKNFNNVMLLDKLERKDYITFMKDSVPTTELYDVTTTICTYDEKGNLVQGETTHTQDDCDHMITTYNYTFDNKGNWIKVDATNQNLTHPKKSNSWSEERQIIYY